MRGRDCQKKSGKAKNAKEGNATQRKPRLRSKNASPRDARRVHVKKSAQAKESLERDAKKAMRRWQSKERHRRQGKARQRMT